MTNFKDNPEKIGRNSNRKNSRNMADAENKDPQHRQPEEHQEDKTVDEDTADPTEMYLPDLDNTPLSQALKNGLDWGIEDEVMVECPKLKQYFGVDTLLVQRISGRVCLHTKNEDEHFPSAVQKPSSQFPYLGRSWKEQNNKEQPPRTYQEKTGHGKSRKSYGEWN